MRASNSPVRNAPAPPPIRHRAPTPKTGTTLRRVPTPAERDHRLSTSEAVRAVMFLHLNYLAANVTRGILRAQDQKIVPTVYNISTWLTKGLQTREEFMADWTDFDEQAHDHANRVLRAFESIVESGAFGLNNDLSPGYDFSYFNDVDESYITPETLEYLSYGRGF